MPKRITRKKRLAVILTAVMLVAGGGAAFAYWSSIGSGSGTATTGTSSAFTVATSTATGGVLTPGGSPQSVAFTVTNPGTGTQTAAAVAVTVANADGTPWIAVTGCSAADYTVGTPTFAPGQIAPGANKAGTVTITMNNLATNQDGCKSASVPLYFSVS